MTTNIKSAEANSAKTENEAKYGIVIHGGAGTITREKMTPELEAAYRKVLNHVVSATYEEIEAGMSAVDAVVFAINFMENSHLFNAGKGSVFTHEGTNELDASIMNGEDLNAGAVAGVTHVKNPITLARAVMQKSKHVMLAREGAETFAKEAGVELVDPEYFRTERRWKQLQNSIAREQAGLPVLAIDHYGTVGAAVLDKKGNLAAGTSTGGMNNKRYGRVGDSPVIGAGTYADNAVCALSATGHGEYFIRVAATHDICARAQYKKISLQEAADQVVMEKLREMGGNGGIIGIGPKGEIVMSFNTEGMYRAAKVEGQETIVKIHGDE